MRGDIVPPVIHFLFIFVVTVATLSILSFLHTTTSLDINSLHSFPLLIHCQTLHSIPGEEDNATLHDIPVQVRLGEHVHLQPTHPTQSPAVSPSSAQLQTTSLALPTGPATFHAVGDHRCSAKEEGLDGDGEAGALTVVVVVKGNICSSAEKQRLVAGVARLMSQGWRKRLSIAKVLVSWSPGGELVGRERIMRDILQPHGYKRVPVGVVLHEKWHGLNRLAVGKLICTRGVLHVDIRALESFRLEDIQWAYHAFQRLFIDRVVQLTCDAPVQGSRCGRGQMTTGSSFFLSNGYHTRLFEHASKDARGRRNMTDLSMQAVYSVVASSNAARSFLLASSIYDSFEQLNHSVIVCMKSCSNDPSMEKDKWMAGGDTTRLATKRMELLQPPVVVHDVGDERGDPATGKGGIAVVSGITLDGFQRAYGKLLRADSHSLPCVHVLVPFGDNASPRVLLRAVNSVVRQTYVKKTIWLVADGNGANGVLDKLCGSFHPSVNLSTYAAHRTLKDITPIVCMATKSAWEESKGSAFAKYLGFRRIQEKIFIDPKDVILVLDGDDYLRGTLALGTLVEQYRNRDCWCSWGGMKGLYAEQGGPLQVREGMAVRPRKSKWLFTHPRTLKVGLAARIEAKDFQDRKGRWVKKATDVGFIYRMIELAGHRHSCYIDEDLYQYTAKTRPKSLDAVSSEQKADYMDHFQGMKPSQPLKSLSNW